MTDERRYIINIDYKDNKGYPTNLGKMEIAVREGKIAEITVPSGVIIRYGNLNLSESNRETNIFK